MVTYYRSKKLPQQSYGSSTATMKYWSNIISITVCMKYSSKTMHSKCWVLLWPSNTTVKTQGYHVVLQYGMYLVVSNLVLLHIVFMYTQQYYSENYSIIVM